jgi:hypothetical protein
MNTCSRPTSCRVTSSFLFCLALVCASQYAYAQTPLTPIQFDSVGQTHRIKKGEKFKIRYGARVPLERCYIRFDDADSDLNPNYFRLQLMVTTEKDEINVPLDSAVYIPTTGAPPEPVRRSDNPDTTIIWHHIGDEYCIELGKRVNFDFRLDADEQKYPIFISYSSGDNGYCLELKHVYGPQVVHFSRLCQMQTVSDPSLATVVLDPAVRYEQLIWTPQRDGRWEVRCGAIEERDCQSPALRDLKLIWKEHPEYNPPRETPTGKAR